MIESNVELQVVHNPQQVDKPWALAIRLDDGETVLVPGYIQVAQRFREGDRFSADITDNPRGFSVVTVKELLPPEDAPVVGESTPVTDEPTSDDYKVAEAASQQVVKRRKRTALEAWQYRDGKGSKVPPKDTRDYLIYKLRTTRSRCESAIAALDEFYDLFNEQFTFTGTTVELPPEDEASLAAEITSLMGDIADDA